MTRYNRRVVVVDAFAGPGRYLGGEEGSPLILVKAYLEHSHQPQMSSEVSVATPDSPSVATKFPTDAVTA